MEAERPPLPPFNTVAAANQKVRSAEDGWNKRDPARVALAYARPVNGGTAPSSSAAKEAPEDLFLKRKRDGEQGYRLIKELWAFRENRIAVRFA